MLTKGIVLTTLILASGSSIAQQSNDQYFQEQQQRQQQAFAAEQARQGHEASEGPTSIQQPSGKWKETWGAIATDGDNGILGTVVGVYTKGDAESSALSDCQKKGGNCKVFAYYNQCAALVTGNHQYTVQSAATIDRATQLGMKECSSKDVGCRVYYTDCSKPVFEQY